MKPSVRQNFVAFTTPFEEKTAWMYLDSSGLVATAMRIQIDPVEAALVLPFVHNSDNTPASKDEVRAEWTKVKNTGVLAHQGAKAAGPPFTTLHLTEDALDQLVLSKLDSISVGLQKRTEFDAFESWPADSQLALLNLAWALGTDFAARWPKFQAACEAEDWVAAAESCHIEDGTFPSATNRNAANLLLFHNAAAVKDRDLDFAILHWPSPVSAASPSSTSRSDEQAALEPTANTPSEPAEPVMEAVVEPAPEPIIDDSPEVPEPSLPAEPVPSEDPGEV